MNRGESANTPPESAALYEALRRSEEQATAGRLALEIMHDIRNPLEALANLTFLTYQQADDPEMVRQYMRMAEEQVLNGSRIASKTLGYAKLSSSPQRTDLVGIAEAALRIHKVAIEAKRIHLVKCFPKELLGEVHVGEILQVLSNLIMNALEAMSPEGSLQLRLKRRDGRLHILVADSGHGISKEHVKEIFRPFFTTKGASGTGLGLAISKSIVDKHHGSLRVRSNNSAERSGTIFRISIPG